MREHDDVFVLCSASQNAGGRVQVQGNAVGAASDAERLIYEERNRGGSRQEAGPVRIGKRRVARSEGAGRIGRGRHVMIRND